MSPKDTDFVTLIAVLRGEAFVRCLWTRKEACEFIQTWYNARETIAKVNPGTLDEETRKGYHVIERWLIEGTVAGNFQYEKDSPATYAMWAFAVEELRGCYIQENVPTIQDRMADSLDRLARGNLPGDEWKQDPPDEEEDEELP